MGIQNKLKQPQIPTVKWRSRVSSPNSKEHTEKGESQRVSHACISHPMLAYRIAPHLCQWDTLLPNCSPAKLLMGRKLRNTIPTFQTPAYSKVARFATPIKVRSQQQAAAARALQNRSSSKENPTISSRNRSTNNH